jgi:hypothetical protein
MVSPTFLINILIFGKKMNVKTGSIIEFTKPFANFDVLERAMVTAHSVDSHKNASIVWGVVGHNSKRLEGAGNITADYFKIIRH